MNINFLQIAAMVLGTLAVVANVLLVIVLVAHVRPRTSQHSLITSLCVGNVLFSISVLLYLMNKMGSWK